jgi:hypothetical protein
MAVDTLGHLLALHVTPANVDDRAEVGKLAAAVQEATGESVELTYADQDYTSENAAEAAKAQGAELCVVELAEEGLRAVAQALGGRAFIRLGDAMQATRQRLRTLCPNPRSSRRRRFRLPHAQTSRRLNAAKCITPLRIAKRSKPSSSLLSR